MKTLKIIENPATHSTFFVIGEHPSGIQISLRIFTEALQNKDHTAILFRARAEQSPDAPEAVSVEHLLKATFPTVKWSGKSTKHGSVAGQMVVDRPSWNADEVLKVLATNKCLEALYAQLNSNFAGTVFELNEDEFVEFFMDQTTTILTKGSKDNASLVPAAVLSFGDFKQKYQLGLPVSELPMPDLQEDDLKPGTGPMVYPAEASVPFKPVSIKALKAKAAKAAKPDTVVEDDDEDGDKIDMEVEEDDHGL